MQCDMIVMNPSKLLNYVGKYTVSICTDCHCLVYCTHNIEIFQPLAEKGQFRHFLPGIHGQQLKLCVTECKAESEIVLYIHTIASGRVVLQCIFSLGIVG